MGEISGSMILAFYDRTSCIHLMGVLCATAEKSGLTKKDKSTAVKLKAVSTNVGLPNKQTDKVRELYCDVVLVHNTRVSSIDNSI